jgi:hypothetical protein
MLDSIHSTMMHIPHGRDFSVQFPGPRFSAARHWNEISHTATPIE